MKWNNTTGRIKYKAAKEVVTSLLGIQILPHSDRSEFLPYYTQMIEWLGNKLLSLEDTGIVKVLEETWKNLDHGLTEIIALKADDLAKEIGLDIEPLDPLADPDQNIEYVHDHFVYSWADFSGTLKTFLSLMYASLMKQDSEDYGFCPCDCQTNTAKAESWKDWENYRSGIYPTDETWCYGNLRAPYEPWRPGNTRPNCRNC